MPHTLLERDHLLDEIAELQRRVATRGGCLVWLGGEAGVGKTTLVHAAVEASARPVLIGHCDALSTPRPLGPLRDMASRGAHRVGRALAAGAARHDLFDAMLDELRSPILAVIEDVHWADDGTVDLLRYLGRRITQTKAVVIVTFRSDEVDANPALRVALGDLASAPGARRLVVSPLSLDGVRSIARGHPLDAVRLHEITGGNPFYVTEVLSTGAWSVPLTVSDAVLARASRLSAGVNATIDIVAIEPAGMEWWLAEALGADADDIQSAVDAGVLTALDGTLRFRHELARLVILARLRSDRCAALHRAALHELLGDTSPDPARLAHHADHGDDSAALARWAPIAARRADGAGSHREAAAQYRRAIAARERLGDDDAELARLLDALSEQLVMVDRQEESLQALERALAIHRRAGDDVSGAATIASISRAHWRMGHGEDAARAIDEASRVVEALPDDATGAIRSRAAVLTTRAYFEMLARRPCAIALADRSIDAARACDDWLLLAMALNARGSARIVLFDDPGGVEDLLESKAIGDTHGSDKVSGDALENLGSALGEVRRAELAERYLEQSVEHAMARDMDAGLRYAQSWRARVRFEQGRWREAEELLDPDLDACLIASIVAATVRGRLLARQGRPGADLALSAAWELAARTQDVQRLWPVVAGRVELAWLTETVSADVVDDLQLVLGVAEAAGMPYAVGELGWWAWKLGLRSGALPASAAVGFQLHVDGDIDGAVAAWDSLGAPYEAAMALSDADDESALRSALDRFVRLGATPMAQRMRRRLREIGARSVPRGPRRTTAASPAGLTARECDVIALVVAGMTNRDIAARLKLSDRTVAHHVAAILRKLGARSRTEAAVLAAAAGLADSAM